MPEKTANVDEVNEGVEIKLEDFPYLSDLGHLNCLPQPWEESTLDEFYHHDECWGPTHLDYRQILADRDPRLKDDPRFKSYRSCRIYFYHDCAFAFFWPVEHHYQGDSVVYTDQPFVLKCGCEHQWKELSQAACRKRGIYHGGNCYHVQECKLCKMVNAYDSSG